MPDLATHPTDDAIEAFALGKIGPADSVLLEEHLTGCDRCQERVEAVAADTLVELLVSAKTKVEAGRSVASTPTLDAVATPSLGAATLAWDSATGLADSEIPAALAGHPKYHAVRRLGTGGMGTVWLAEHAVMNRSVAIKVIRPDLLTRPGAAGRFLREVRAAARLHHPHIVTAFDAEQAGDSCLLVMVYVPGETLGEQLADGPLPVAEACRVVRDAARGLAHAHAAGLVHRDVKLHNLIRAADGTVKVLDFGLAGVGAGELVAAGGEGLTGAGMVVGTPHYIAPEQVADPHSADARADVYGLGCTLYHLLAGRPPFPDGTVAETLTAHQEREPDPIPGLAAEIAAVLAKMMAKKPADRYQTADAVVAALERVIASAERQARRAKVRRQVHTWAALAASLLIVGTAGVVFKIQRDNREITIATDDPDIEVVMKRKGEVLRVIDKKTGQEWTIDTTTNQIAQADRDDGLKLDLPENQAVVLRRKDGKVFSVTRVTLTAVANPVGELRSIDAGHGGIWRAVLSADGRHVLATGDDGVVSLWDARTGAAVRPLKGHTKAVWSLALSRDGATAVSGSTDETVRVWEVSTGLVRRVLMWPGHPIRSVALSPDGKYVLAGSQAGGVRMWETVTGTVAWTQTGHAGNVHCVAFSSDGTRALSTDGVWNDPKSAGVVRIWDVKAGAELRQLVGHTLYVGAAAFSPDGRSVLSGSRDGTLRLWDVNSGREERKFDCPWTESVAFSPDGRRALTGGRDPVVRLWDLDAGQVIARLAGHTDAAVSVDYGADGRTGVSAGWDGTVRLWRLPDSSGPRGTFTLKGNDKVVWGLTLDGAGQFKIVRNGQLGVEGTYKLTGDEIEFTDVAGPFRTEGPMKTGTYRWRLVGPRLIFFNQNDQARGRLTTLMGGVWEARAAEPVGEVRRFAGHNGWACNAVLLPGGRRLLTCEMKRLLLWDAVTGERLKTFDGHTGDVWGLAVSADGRRAVSSSTDGTVRVWDLEGGKQVHVLKGHNTSVASVALLPDGKRALSVGDDGTMRLWDLEKGEEVRKYAGHGGRVWTVAVSADGRRAWTGGDDGTVRVWDVEAGVQRQSYPTKRVILALALSGDDRYALVGLADDPTAHLWDAESGKEVRQLKGHSKGLELRGVAFSPDGQFALTGSHDQTVRLWEVETGKELHTFLGHTDDVLSVTFAPDGRHTLSASKDGTARLWRAPEPPPVVPAQVGKFSRLDGPVFGAAVSRDGRTAYAVNAQGTVKYRTAKGERLWATGPDCGGDTIALPADERFVLVWTPDGRARILDPATGKLQRDFKGPGDVLGTVLSPDGTRAATGHGDVKKPDEPGSIRVWDVTGGKELFTLDGPKGPTPGLAFSPDGRRIATASYDGTIRLWDAGTGKEVHKFDVEGGVSAVAFTPDGNRLLTCGEDSNIRVWDIAAKKEAGKFFGHDVWPNTVAVTPDGTRAVSAGFGLNKSGDGLRVWDLATGKQLHHFGDIREIYYSIVFTADSTRMVTAGHDGFVRVWRLPDPTAPAVGKVVPGPVAPPTPPTGQFRKFGRFQGEVHYVAADPDGRHVYAVDGAATKWDTATGTASWEAPLGGEGGGQSVAVTTKGRGRVLAGCWDGAVRVLDAGTGKVLHTHKLHSERVLAVTASPDGMRAVSSSGFEDDDGLRYAIKAWEVETGKVLFELKGHDHMTWGVAFSPDGKLLATASDDGTVRLWAADTGKELHVFRGHKGSVATVAFSPNGTRLASAGEDLVIRLWDVPGRKFDRALEGHDVWVGDLKYTPDGSRLVSVGSNIGRTDGLRVWDVATGKLLAHFREPSSRINGLAVLSGGLEAVTVEDDGVLRLYRLPAKE